MHIHEVCMHCRPQQPQPPARKSCFSNDRSRRYIKIIKPQMQAQMLYCTTPSQAVVLDSVTVTTTVIPFGKGTMTTPFERHGPHPSPVWGDTRPARCLHTCFLIRMCDSSRLTTQAPPVQNGCRTRAKTLATGAGFSLYRQTGISAPTTGGTLGFRVQATLCQPDCAECTSSN